MRRRLTHLERIMWTLGQSFPVGIGASARVRGRCTEEDLRSAIKAVSVQHAMLRARVGDAGVMIAWLTDDGAEPTLRVVAEGDWNSELEAEVQQPFDTDNGPLARFVMVEGTGCFDLLFVCHHLVTDGLGMGYVLRDVVAQLADPARPAAEVPAPRIDDLVKRLGRPEKLKPFKQPGGKWPVRDRTQGRGFSLLTWSLDQGETVRLQERCREEKTSVHAALSLAGLRALSDADGHASRQLYSPVNVRNVLPGLPEGAIADYALELFTWVDASSGEDFWTVSRRLKETLREQTRPERLINQMRMLGGLRFFPNATMRALLRISCKPDFSFTFSNLGRVPFETSYDGFEIESMYAAVHMGTLNNGLLAAATVADKLCLAMGTTLAGRPAAERFAEGMMGHLRLALH